MENDHCPGCQSRNESTGMDWVSAPNLISVRNLSNGELGVFDSAAETMSLAFTPDVGRMAGSQAAPYCVSVSHSGFAPITR